MHSQSHKSTSTEYDFKNQKISIIGVSRVCNNIPNSWAHRYDCCRITMGQWKPGSLRGKGALNKRTQCRGHCARWQGSLDLLCCSFNASLKAGKATETCSIIAVGIYFCCTLFILFFSRGLWAWPLCGCHYSRIINHNFSVYTRNIKCKTWTNIWSMLFK